MELKDKYVLWTAEDFAESRIQETVRYICANVRLIHLLQPNALWLHDGIDSLARADNDTVMLTRARFAYNMSFDLPTEVISTVEGRVGQSLGMVSDMAELITLLPLDENGGLSSPYRIIVDDDAAERETVRGLMAELLQQFVFLNLNLDVMSKSEIRKNIIKERFRREYPEMERRLNRAIADMDDIMGQRRFSAKGQESAAELRASLEAIREELGKARKRPIRIAVMGTKKAGKSVTINCLLGQEYAPTSSELPTPNVIRYVPESMERGLWLDYKGEHMTFASAEEIKAYIQGEFEEAKKHTGEAAALENMIVHYPTDALTGFEIYDTPGPDFAGAGNAHARLAEACIQNADVCIFVINYSKHLDDGEIAFLEKIRNYFEENGKFYSLLIAVNRVDERYSAEVEKSLARVIDYIRKRLGDLQYPHIVTFGTSALQGFYLTKIRELCAVTGHPQDEPIDLDVVRALKKTHGAWMTQLRFIDESLGRLEDFHGYENPTDTDLERMSGVPQLLRYVHYIGAQKADLEIVDHVISSCEMKVKSVKNALEVTKLVESRDRDIEKIRMLESYVIRLNKEVDRILCQLVSVVSDDTILAAETKVQHISADSTQASCRDAEDRIRALVARLEVFHCDMEEIYGNKESSKLDETQNQAAQVIAGVSAEMARHIQNGIAAFCEGKRTDLETSLQRTQEQIQEAVGEIDQELEQEKDVQTMFRSFELPTFPASLEIPTTSTDALKNLLTEGKLKELASSHRSEDKVERAASSLWEKFRAFVFDKKYYEKRTTYDIEGFKNDLAKLMIGYAHESIEEARKVSMPNEVETATGFVRALYVQRKEYEADYQRIFASYLDMLALVLDDTNEHKEAVQRDIAAFLQLGDATEAFFELFDDVVAMH